MRALVFFIALLPWMSGGAQVDTLYANRWQIADTLYGLLGQHIPTEFLTNRAHAETNAYMAYQTSASEPGSADLYYELLLELKLMALDSSMIPTRESVLLSASTFVSDYEFEEDRYVYPIGIADFKANSLNVYYGQNSGLINLNGVRLSDASSNNSAYSEEEIRMIAPLFDYFNSNNLSVIFRESDFISNYRDVNEISSIVVEQDGLFTTLQFDQEYSLTIQDSSKQYLGVVISYSDGTTLERNFVINTPTIPVELAQGIKASICAEEGEIVHDNIHKLKYCVKYGCGNTTGKFGDPFILVTGYRPPIFGQSFDKTWQYYNDEHSQLLNLLLVYGYDVIIVKFNIHNTPQTHGMNESADLFIDFIKTINTNKTTTFSENVISASSMASDIVRLALLKMEEYHQTDNSYPHHKTRLLIHYDANLYGANIPLATQYQAYSGFFNPGFNLTGVFTTFLKTFLFLTNEQKTVKELLRYHAGTYNIFNFAKTKVHEDLTPDMHQKRIDFNTRCADYDNGLSFISLPRSPRQIAISLGKISGTNDVNPPSSLYQPAGGYWLNHPQYKWRSGVFDQNPTLLFKRYEININPFIGIPMLLADHEINVQNMLPIDNASGSYLGGVGNLLTVTDMAYFPQNHTVQAIQDLFNGQDNSSFPRFSHKSVVTALGIHPSQWEPYSSLTVNPQILGLMYDQFNISLPQSNLFGYPNIGRPNDHFAVTPFEAIYVDNEIDAHIRLNNSDFVDDLTYFILNEVDPYYLALQNQRLGDQARPNYLYQTRRTAVVGITCGHLVTPKTDPGDYVVRPNAQLILNAGEFIEFLPGTSVEFGAWGDFAILSNYCIGKQQLETDIPLGTRQALRTQTTEIPKTPTSTEIQIYPNPGVGAFTVVSMNNVPIRGVQVYDLQGKLIFSNAHIHSARYILAEYFEKGSYIVVIETDTGSHVEKLIVL